MKNTAPVHFDKVSSVVCNRCRKAADVEDMAAKEFTSIDFVGGYASVFGDGARVELDFCQQCLKEVLGPWLQITTTRDQLLQVAASAFNAARHRQDGYTDAPVSLECLAEQARDVSKRRSQSIDEAFEAVEASSRRIDDTETAARIASPKPSGGSEHTVDHVLVEQDIHSGEFVSRIIGFPHIEFEAPSFAEAEAKARTYVRQLRADGSIVLETRFVGVVVVEPPHGLAE